MTRRAAASKTSQLRAAQNQIRGSATPRAALSRARPLVQPSEMQAFVDWLPTVRRGGQGISFDHFPRSLKELWRSGTLGRANLSRELAWAVAMFQPHAEVLASFRSAAIEYERFLVEDRLADCVIQLDEMERQFGTSLWVIETRIALLQRADGLEAQKAYASTVQRARGQHDVVSFLSYQFSRRNEPSTTPLRYVKQLEDLVAAWEDADDLGVYVLYRLGNKVPVVRRFADVLRFESSAALVDHYETFVHLSACAAAAEDEVLRATFRSQVVRAAELVDDSRLRRAAFLLTVSSRWLDRLPPVGAHEEDALVLGEADRAEALLKAAIEEDPCDARTWCVAAGLPTTSTPQFAIGGCIRAVSIERMRSLMGRSGDVDASVIALLRDALNHRLQGFSPIVNAFVWGEMVALPALASRIEMQAFAFERGLRPSDLGRVAAAGQKAMLAVASRAVVPEERSPALTDQLVRNAIPPDLWGSLPAASVNDLPAEALMEAEMFRALGQGDHEAVLAMSARVVGDFDRPRRRRVSRFVALSLLESGRIGELAELIARACVGDAAVAGMLPLAECARGLDRTARRRSAADLSVPIVLDLYSKRFDDGLDDVRAFAYEDFLLAQGVERPSQLEGREGEFELPLLIYYLRNLCVPNVMQVSSAFQATRELEDERKRVLSILVRLDPSSAKDYEAELREITRAQLIHRGVRHVERSRIYVDVPAIKRAFEKKHRETFLRFQALYRAGIGADDGELERALQEALSGKPLPQRVLEVPKNEVNDLLLQMLRWLFEECSTSPEHGLDCYLSMRIRHGTLSGQLRTPLEMERIITQRASETDIYATNTYWMERLGQLPEEARLAVDERLARFSATYDIFIDRIAQEMIQIRRPERPLGLFRISLTAVRFRLWVADLSADMSFDDFFDRSMDVFWRSVDDSLSQVRSTIDDVLKPETNAMFAELEADLRGLAQGTATVDLDRAIRTARTGTLQALDIVKDWFRLSQSVSEPPFPIDDMIDVGLQCVKAIHHEFDPLVVRNVDPLPPFAGALVLFSDIFFIIFDNVRRHSGAGPHPKVSIEVKDVGERLRIVARSQVAHGFATLDAIDRVAAIERAIDVGDYASAVRSEGGTGLIKLRKLVGRDDGRGRRLAFGFEGEEFVVELELGTREIQR